MRDNFEPMGDNELYKSFDSYKALLEAGVSKKEALEKTGLTEQIVKNLEMEEEDLFSDTGDFDEWEFQDNDDLEMEMYDEDGEDWNNQDSSFDDPDDLTEEDF